ncbi:hypothetical protein J6Q66_05960 [bacterium]|nr:hypothetical protein [bacterium]
MNYNFFNNDFDKCIIKGQCVQEPYINAINEYIFEEISEIIYYIEELKNLNYINKKFERELINIIAKSNIDNNFQGKDLLELINEISKRKLDLIKRYQKICKECFSEVKLKPKRNEKIKKIKISDIAKYGERIFLKRQKKSNTFVNAIYMILLSFVKTIVKNLTELYEYKIDLPDINEELLKLILKIKNISDNKEEIILIIKKLNTLNFKIIKEREKIYHEKYGEIKENDVKFSSRKNKCILISGQDLKILADIIDVAQKENIDIYTHDKMIFAYQYDYFAQKENLVGQFQKSQLSFKYDFVSFPGPIIIDNFQQNNFTGMYQGNFFTTNSIAPYGMRVLNNDNYSELFETAKAMKGFKKAHEKPIIKIGYKQKELVKFVDELKENLISKKYNSILFLGLYHHQAINKEYYDELIKHIPNSTFLISLAYDIDTENSKHFASYYDNSLSFKILEELQKLKNKTKFDINVFITDCTSKMLENIMILNYFDVKNIFIQECQELPNTQYFKEILKKYFKTNLTNFILETDLNNLKFNLS